MRLYKESYSVQRHHCYKYMQLHVQGSTNYSIVRQTILCEPKTLSVVEQCRVLLVAHTFIHIHLSILYSYWNLHQHVKHCRCYASDLHTITLDHSTDESCIDGFTIPFSFNQPQHSICYLMKTVIQWVEGKVKLNLMYNISTIMTAVHVQIITTYTQAVYIVHV